MASIGGAQSQGGRRALNALDRLRHQPKSKRRAFLYGLAAMTASAFVGLMLRDVYSISNDMVSSLSKSSSSSLGSSEEKPARNAPATIAAASSNDDGDDDPPPPPQAERGDSDSRPSDNALFSRQQQEESVHRQVENEASARKEKGAPSTTATMTAEDELGATPASTSSPDADSTADPLTSNNSCAAVTCPAGTDCSYGECTDLGTTNATAKQGEAVASSSSDAHTGTSPLSGEDQQNEARPENTPSTASEVEQAQSFTQGNLDGPQSHGSTVEGKAPASAPTVNPIGDAPPKRMNVTETGIGMTDPALYATVDLMGDSTNATILALASGYEFEVYRRFVGSLRLSGYRGRIIMGVSPDPPAEIVQYLEYRNVTMKRLQWVNCTRRNDDKWEKMFKKFGTCAHPYPEEFIMFSRFALARDWLMECDACTGPVLFIDVRDVYFQLDPFGPGSPPVTGLQLYSEHRSKTLKRKFCGGPIRRCKGVSYTHNTLNAGSTVGVREAVLKYLEVLYEEMQVWMKTPKCDFNDQVRQKLLSVFAILSYQQLLSELTFSSSPFAVRSQPLVLQRAAPICEGHPEPPGRCRQYSRRTRRPHLHGAHENHENEIQQDQGRM